MIAYIGVAPVVGAFADKLPRRAFLVAMDLIRCGVALVLPFVTEIWQVYVLIFLLQSASAAFTPTFQATIPDVLPKEADYTRALSLSRLAYDLESLLSPMLAAVLLSVMSFHWLLAGTAVGFIGSAVMVLSVALPRSPAKPRTGGIYAHTTRGIRFYLKSHQNNSWHAAILDLRGSTQETIRRGEEEWRIEFPVFRRAVGIHRVCESVCTTKAP